MNFQDILVYPGEQVSGQEYRVGYYNPTPYRFLGAGAQGAVFEISPYQCVKIFAHSDEALQEGNTLLQAAAASIVPRVYELGPNYIVMELIRGHGIKTVLANHQTMPEHISAGLVDMLKQMKQVGFTRIDTALRHVFITPEQKIKVIDHVNSYRIVQPYPARMLRSLSAIGFLESFVQYVKHADPGMFSEWVNAGIL